MGIFLIYFLTFLNLPARKLFYAEKFERHLDTLPTIPKLGLGVFL